MVSGEYIMKTTIMDYDKLVIAYLKDTFVNFDIIYLPTCGSDIFYLQLNVDTTLSDYLGNTNTTYILFLDSGSIGNQLFTNNNFTVNGKSISLETKYMINDVVINLQQYINAKINYIKYDVFDFFGANEFPFPSPQCTLQFKLCYKDCKTCNGLGTDLEMKCNSCFDFFFFYL